MQICELMNIPTLQNSRIAAGRAGMDRTVNSVNMMDAPDIVEYLKPNELLLTTAFAVKDRPEMLVTLVKQMAETGCAGLAIKTKRFLEEIPGPAIDEADRLGLPILELPLEHSLGEVLNQSLSCILQSRNEELSYALETHRSFFNLILKGEGVQEIVEKLSELIEAPILIMNAKQELISFSSHLKPDFSLLNELTAAWSVRKSNSAAGLIPVGLRGGAMQYSFIQPIPTYQRQGFIIAFPQQAEMNTMHTLAMEQAANVLGFELLKAQAVKDKARRFKIEFFTELVHGEITSEQEIMHRGKQYGLPSSDTMLCIVCGKDSEENQLAAEANTETAERKSREIDHLYHVLKKEYSQLGAPFVLFTLKNTFVCLLSAKDLLGPDGDGKQKLAQQLLAISDRQLEGEDIKLSYGISSPFAKLTDISVAYKQAIEAYRHGRTHNKQRYVQYYHTKEFTDLLRLIPADDLQEFVQDTFEAWSGIDENEQREWSKTLRVFYDTHCHIGETAKQLYIHRNTVLYRLNRIEQLTGVQVRNTADSLRIRMALMIRELFN